MASTVGKLALLLFVVFLLSAAPVFADSTTTFTFTSTPGNIGTTDTFMSGGLSLTLTGYSSPNVTAAMFAKNLGGDENGVGIAGGIFNEISGTGFIQIDFTSILAAHPSGITLSLGSIQSPDAYNVWQSNTPGNPGSAPILMNQTGLSLPITVTSAAPLIFISASAPADSILLDDVEVTTPTPEPSSAGMLLIGLGILAAAGTLGKKLLVA